MLGILLAAVAILKIANLLSNMNFSTGKAAGKMLANLDNFLYGEDNSKTFEVGMAAWAEIGVCARGTAAARGTIKKLLILAYGWESPIGGTFTQLASFSIPTHRRWVCVHGSSKPSWVIGSRESVVKSLPPGSLAQKCNCGY